MGWIKISAPEDGIYSVELKCNFGYENSNDTDQTIERFDVILVFNGGGIDVGAIIRDFIVPGVPPGVSTTVNRFGYTGFVKFTGRLSLGDTINFRTSIVPLPILRGFLEDITLEVLQLE